MDYRLGIKTINILKESRRNTFEIGLVIDILDRKCQKCSIEYKID
jgi:hypothetical protein